MSVLSFLYVGSYIVIVVASLLLYGVTAFMDPGFVPIVNQTSVSAFLQLLLGVILFLSGAWLQHR